MKKVIAIAAVASLVLGASSASASVWPFPSQQGSDLDIRIDVDSDAYVKNVVNTTASTGGNSSSGGSARNRVKGGSVDDTTATGGNTDGIDTGDAVATSYVDNYVNDNEISVKSDCGCRGDADIDVDVNSDATVKNYVDTKAKTGHNSSFGGNASNKVKAKSSSHGLLPWVSTNNNVDDTSATGGDAGEIKTGDADAWTEIVNVVNSNVVRVRR